VPIFSERQHAAGLITHPLPALAAGYGSEDVKAALEPVIKALCDLDGLVFGVIGG